MPQERLDGRGGLAGPRADPERGHSSKDGHYAEDAEPYMHYVLALAGKGRKARIQKLVEALRRQARGEAARWRASARSSCTCSRPRSTSRATGATRSELRNPDCQPVTDVRNNGWTFYSDRRRRGFMLSTFHDLFGNDPGGEPLARRVAEGLRASAASYYTTQELVWGVTGLGKWVEKAADEVQPAHAASRTARRWRRRRTSAAARRIAPGRWPARASVPRLQLQVKDKGEGALYLMLASDGVRTDGQYRYGGEGLSVRRTYRTLQGDAVQPTAEPRGARGAGLRGDRAREHAAASASRTSRWWTGCPRAGRSRTRGWAAAAAWTG